MHLSIARAWNVAFFNLVVLAFMPFGLEMALRWTDPTRSLPHEGYYLDYFYTWSKLVYENRHGFREVNYSPEKPDGAFRVMLLGDSFTYGVGLTDVERYGNILAQLLQRFWPDRQIEVLNFGQPATCATEYLAVLRQHIDEVQPDRIVMGFCYNDPKPGRQEDTPERFAFQERFPWLTTGLENFFAAMNLPRTGKFLGERIEALAIRLGLFPHWRDSVDAAYNTQSDAWRDFASALAGIKAISDKAGLPPPIFASLATYKDPASASSENREQFALFQRWHRQAEAEAALGGWTVIGYEQDIPADTLESALRINRIDAHPSFWLNQVYAWRLFEALTGQMSGPGAPQPPTGGL